MKSKKINDAKVSALADCEGGGAVYQGRGGAGEGEEYGVGWGALGSTSDAFVSGLARFVEWPVVDLLQMMGTGGWKPRDRNAKAKM